MNRETQHYRRLQRYGRYVSAFGKVICLLSFAVCVAWCVMFGALAHKDGVDSAAVRLDFVRTIFFTVSSFFSGLVVSVFGQTAKCIGMHFEQSHRHGNGSSIPNAATPVKSYPGLDALRETGMTEE